MREDPDMPFALIFVAHPALEVPKNTATTDILGREGGGAERIYKIYHFDWPVGILPDSLISRAP